MAQRDGLRLFLRLHGRRDRPVDAVAVPQSDPDFPVGREARLQPDHRYGGRGDQVHEGVERGRAGQAVLPLLRARRHALAASADAGMDREDQRHALFDKGWNDLREQIFANQKRLGVIPANTQLTPWPDDILPQSGRRSIADEKKLFTRQAEVFAAYVAYTDHEIGRVIQAVEDMGKLDNTLIIYICGDNGTSAEGSTGRHAHSIWPRFKASNIPVADQLKVLRRLGLSSDLPAHVGGVVVGLRYAVQMDQAGGIAFRRHPAGHGDLVARSHQGRRRHPHAVPPRDRHCADDPRSHGHSGTGDGQRHCPETDRRREHGLHLRQGQRERTVNAHDAVFRDVRQPRHLPRRLDRRHDAARCRPGCWARPRCPRWSTATNGNSTTSPKITRRTTISRPRCRTSCATCRNSSWWRRRNTTCSRWTIRSSRARSRRDRARPPGEPYSLTRVKYPACPPATHPASCNKSYTITAEVEIPARRRRGYARHARWPLRRLWSLPAQGQAGLHLQPARPGAVPLGRLRGAHAGQAHHRV